MAEYKYEVELLEDLPEEIPLKKCGIIITKREWYGHSYGDAVGRIYDNGKKVESFFKKDIEQGNTNLFDLLMKTGKLKEKHRMLVNYKTGEDRSCNEYYVMRRVKGHSSAKPTVTNRMDNCRNVEYRYTYEILLAEEDGFKRYITNTIETDGMFCHGFSYELESLEDIFEEMIEEKREGFRKDKEGTIYVKFYDDFGEEIEAEYYRLRDLLLCVNSVRIIELEEIIKK